MQVETGARRVAVVYESMFGNTEAVARSIADGAASRGAAVTVMDVLSAPDRVGDVDLLIVGGPTHAFGMSRPATRTAAREQGAKAATDGGVREWLAGVDRPAGSVRAACFDTRIRKPFPVGSAARAIARRLRRLGFDVAKPVSFTVTDTPGPMADGELERAREWGASLVPSTSPATRARQ